MEKKFKINGSVVQMESGRIHVIVDVHSIFLCPQWSRCGLQGSKRALSNSGWIILLKIVFGPRRSVLMLKGFSLWMMQLNLIRDLLYSSINGDKRTCDRSAQENNEAMKAYSMRNKWNCRRQRWELYKCEVVVCVVCVGGGGVCWIGWQGQEIGGKN